MKDLQLSNNFTLKELTRSSAAETYNLDNTPKSAAIENLKILCEKILQPTRDELKKPIIVNSGYRSQEVNKKVGGVSTSYHLKGQAADLHVDNTQEGARLSALLLSHKLTDLVILEKRGRKVWVHVQWSYAPRHIYKQDFK